LACKSLGAEQLLYLVTERSSIPAVDVFEGYLRQGSPVVKSGKLLSTSRSMMLNGKPVDTVLVKVVDKFVDNAKAVGFAYSQSDNNYSR
jgi:hypothetical protein